MALEQTIINAEAKNRLKGIMKLQMFQQLLIGGESESENDEERESKFRLLNNRYLIIDPQIFQKEITSSIVCKRCHFISFRS